MIRQIASQKRFSPPNREKIQRENDYCNALSKYFSLWSSSVSDGQVLKLGELSENIHCYSPFCHQIILTENITPKLKEYANVPNISVIKGTPFALPFIERSINAVILTDFADLSDASLQIFQEIHRTCTNDALLFIALFNPFGKLGFKHLVSRQMHLIRVVRPACCITHRLKSLHFDILAKDYLNISGISHFYAPFIVIVARKQTYSPTVCAKKVSFLLKNNDILIKKAYNTPLLTFPNRV